jgi:hypothetical protein
VAGLEKAVLAIVIGLKALKPVPQPPLESRRNWARLAVGLAAAHVVLVVTVILLNLHRIPKIIEVFRAMSDLR